MQSCMVTLVFQVICKYFEVYRGFKSAVIHHIPHKYSNEMKQKSKQISNSFKVVVHFTVTGCKRVDLVLIQRFLIYYVLMLTFVF